MRGEGGRRSGGGASCGGGGLLRRPGRFVCGFEPRLQSCVPCGCGGGCERRRRGQVRFGTSGGRRQDASQHSNRRRFSGLPPGRSAEGTVQRRKKGASALLWLYSAALRGWACRVLYRRCWVTRRTPSRLRGTRCASSLSALLVPPPLCRCFCEQQQRSRLVGRFCFRCPTTPR